MFTLSCLPHLCIHSYHSFTTITNKWSVFLSDLFSLGSRPDRPAHCRHLTNRTGDQHEPRVGRQDPSASHVCPPPSFRPRTDGSRLLCSPLMGQTAPGQDPMASSATIHIQQTVNKHGAEQFTLKAGPVMQVDVHGTAQPMRAASHTVRDQDWAV
jgi:hypothetical protein